MDKYPGKMEDYKGKGKVHQNKGKLYNQVEGKMNDAKGKMYHQKGKIQNQPDYKMQPKMNPNMQNWGMGPKQPYVGGMQQGQMQPNVGGVQQQMQPNVGGVQQSPMQPNSQMKPEMHKKQMFDMCNKHHLYLVQVETVDGQLFEGIIDEYDEDGVTLIVPSGDMDDDRGGPGFGLGGGFGPGFGFGPGGGPGYGFGPGFGPDYGYGYPRRFRRFRRYRYPFFNLSRIFFPFFL